MKKIFLLFISVYAINNSYAQLTITSGAQFVLAGNAQLTLSNIDLVNNGGLTSGTGSILFTGNAVNKISGIQNMVLYDLGIGKTSGSVQLQVPVAVSHQVNFTFGLLDLNGNDLNLGTTGALNGEQETSHIIGSNGGNVVYTTSLNAPSSANPGNLGLLITSSQNLGNTIIRRGHQSQTGGSGNGNSILRYYDITPAVNNGLNATLRFNYLTAELNALDENTLEFYQQQNGASWKSIGFDSRNTSSNYVDKNNIASFSRFTLSSINNALPVQFISFTAVCNGSNVLLNWKTASELNSAYYAVQKSTDALAWATIGKLAAAGNASAENNYSFTDNTVNGNNYYRIAEYDVDGKTTLSNIASAGCNMQEAFAIWPNPVSNTMYIRITVRNASEANIKLFDSKGALVKQKINSLANGTNMISMDVKGIAAGLYFVNVTYNNGQAQLKKIMVQ
ncbi:MAG: T9SS type A sorting domain-containing protein [Chitinophagaceae bacterium]